MRALLVLVLPLLVQVFAYIVVFLAARSGGSFIGLLAMPVAAVSLLVLVLVAIDSLRRTTGIVRPMAIGLVIALLPPIALLILRALES